MKEIGTYVRTYSWGTIWYEYHGLSSSSVAARNVIFSKLFAFSNRSQRAKLKICTEVMATIKDGSSEHGVNRIIWSVWDICYKRQQKFPHTRTSFSKRASNVSTMTEILPNYPTISPVFTSIVLYLSELPK